MLNSSYTVPCNPNTMRDTGAQRNAIYSLRDPAEEMYKSFNKQKRTDIESTIKDEQRVKEAMQARCKHKRPATGEPETQLLPLNAGVNGAVQETNDKGFELITTVGGVDTLIGP